MKKNCYLPFVCALGVACYQQPPETAATVTTEAVAGNEQEPVDGEPALEKLGLIDIATLDEGIRVQLVYATPYNFMGKTLYKNIRRAYLQPDAAQKLLRAYKALKKIRPDLTLLVYDAARPLSVQWEMWNAVKGTEWNYYVKNPGNGGGMHNFGAAVDLTLADCTGQPLSMGTPYDYFGYEAHIDKEKELVQTGRITPREWENRLLLRKVMTGAGFRTVKSEWWHFNACSLEEAKKQYEVIRLGD
ncbi:MAG: M15 family metallopeptidase [Prevotellaceae bacterium]|jgi:D-alanyl-D-alanine dipeptidase|nr:M15 family metallopeptidase [Prevotellaceae bacterium]